ncbi:MAG: hypothetical protein U0805_13540 [Pirellulales bacterium]
MLWANGFGIGGAPIASQARRMPVKVTARVIFPEWVDLDNNGAYTPGWVNWRHPDVEPFDASVVAEFLLPPRSPVLKKRCPPAADMGTFVTQANYESNFATLADAQVDDHAASSRRDDRQRAANKGVATGARLYSARSSAARRSTQ